VKIVQIVTQLHAGGAQRVALLLADGLRERGHGVETWFLYQLRSAFTGDAGISVILPSSPSRPQAAALPARLIARLRAGRFDAVLTHTHYSNIIGQLAATIAGIPARVAVQHNPVETYPSGARLLDRMFGTLGLYTDIVSVSHTIASSYATYPSAYRAKSIVIPNAVPTPPPTVDPALLRRYGIPSGVPLLLNVGRLHPQKDQRILIRALGEISEAHLVIVGEGELRSQLEQLAGELRVQSRLHLIGEIPWEDTMALMRQSDLFVFPSLYEGMPLVVIEAMTSGQVIIGSDIPSIREVLGDAGEFVMPSDPESLASAITSLLANPDRRRELSHRARDRARLFSLEKVSEAYLSVVTNRVDGK
jgi:glycosyltransferase involved in cell wall biosynthesis